MEFDAKILTGRPTGKYTTDVGKAGPGHRTIDGSFASYRKGTRMSKFRGCGARAHGLKGISMRSAQTLTVERLESRCVLSAWPIVSVAPATAPAVRNDHVNWGPIATPPQPDVHGVISRDDNSAAYPVPPNSDQSSIWDGSRVATPHNSDPSGEGGNYSSSLGRTNNGLGDSGGAIVVDFGGRKGLSASTSQISSDQASSGTVQDVASAKTSEATVRDQAGQSDTAVSRMAGTSPNQSSSTVAPWMAHSASLMPGRAASQLVDLILGKQFLASGGAKVFDGSQTGGDSAAIQLARAGVASLAGAEMLADVVHGGLPLLAEMHLNLPNVQQALDTVMADIKLIGTEVSEWLGGVRFTPAVLAVTAATAGAGAAAYLRRRKGRETGDHDDEASSSWLFARLQPIPLE